MTTSRRSFITGLVSLVAAPAIVRAGSLMPVRVMVEPVYGIGPMMYALPLMKRESSIIDDIFLRDLFKTLSDYPEMTATQVLERVNFR